MMMTPRPEIKLHQGGLISAAYAKNHYVAIKVDAKNKMLFE